MGTFIIATEGGIQIEVKKDLTKKQIEKTKKFFSEAKEFVSDIDKDITMSLQDGTIVLGTMLSSLVVPHAVISSYCEKLEGILKKVNNFINDLPNEKEVEAPKDEKELDTKKAICDAFNSLKKAIPNAGVFIMVFDPNESGAHLAGDLKKNFVLSTLLMNND